MASIGRRLPENVPGEFYVDDSCIDCETCMIVAPEVFAESERPQACVHRQPEGDDGRRRALMALVACPTSSIGAGESAARRAETAEAARAFPEPIADDIHYCGYASESSFGASSYLIRRPSGNVLIDSPRAAEPLLRSIEALGGVRFLFLTHRDDVADHAKFRRRFGCERLLHEDDRDAATRDIERPLRGAEPIPLADDLLIIPVPGHTRGSCALLHGETLFSGDHLWADAAGRLAAGRSVCWYSWEEQTRSMERLLAHSFRRVLPGHGRRFEAPTPREARAALLGLIARMARRVGPAPP